MKNFLLFILLLFLAGELVTLAVMKIRPRESNVLAEATVVPTATTTPTATPTETPSPTPIPTKPPTPRPSPTVTPVPQPTFSSQQINELINRFAGQYGVSPDVMRYIALCESGFNPLAKNAGYAGLFQFGSVTWKNLRTEIGESTDPDLRFNAEEATQTAAYALSKGKAGLWPNCYP